VEGVMSNQKAASLSHGDAERFRSFERQRHDKLAPTYLDFATPITALAINPLLQAAQVRAGNRLLDVASGPGTLAFEAEKLGTQAFGVDLSLGMIDLAKKSYPKIDFRVGDVEHLPFDNQSFDAIVCNFGLGHFPNPEASVAECVRTLKPGGRIALSWWDQPNKIIQGIFLDAITEVGARPPPDVPTGYSVFRFSDSEEFSRLLKGAGLSEVVIEEHKTTYLIPDAETLWRGGLGSFALTASAIAHQDAMTQSKIRAALERRASAYQTADGLRLPVAFKIGVGRKTG
jgi:ubiquinone/menaquinone biosynthesis C-methylase UbiE